MEQKIRKRFVPKAEKCIAGIKPGNIKVKDSARMFFTMCCGRKYYFPFDVMLAHRKGLIWSC
jgi:hypothetical protein